ncbi:MAG: PIN/TRAM domain-containing protein [Clostridia bacterium]|nr:PIN/TRAM domain-containing protein [Clostridia bacterium]
MIKKFVRIFLTLFLTIIGFVVTSDMMTNAKIFKLFDQEPPSTVATLVTASVVALTLGFIGYVGTAWLIRHVKRLIDYTEVELEKIPSGQIITGSIGLIFGLIIAYLISTLYNYFELGIVNSVLSIITYVFLGYIGISVATKRMADPMRLSEVFKRSGLSISNKGATKKSKGARPKILDTSVIIDGRIADICKTGFVEGPIVIPEFVLEELRHIADSSDALKRNRGRRGLDILKIIQRELNLEVQITDKDFEDVGEVDIKLLKLAQAIDGMVVTNDFNLNKVADLQGVAVLNINELANAIKPVVLPGEEMTVHIIKDGKENNQGVAYLDDGTMIVVEGGRKFMNQTKKVTVTSVLQTAAGRMIFAKPQ